MHRLYIYTQRQHCAEVLKNTFHTCGGTFERLLSTQAHLVKITASFIGKISEDSMPNLLPPVKYLRC
jgi:hypothetical protein